MGNTGKSKGLGGRLRGVRVGEGTKKEKKGRLAT